jgi:prophage maintenance system killer protein
VAAALRRVQRDFDAINARLRARREPMSDRVVENMVSGYATVDRLLAAGVDVFAMGSLHHVLELNTVVLCGTDPARREQYARHREATERRFYEQPDGGIRDLVEWSAGLFVRMLSTPQLFVEGNHRTGALLMSYVLLRAGLPPFVLTPENAAAYFDPSAAIQGIDKSGAAVVFRLPAITRRRPSCWPSTRIPST